MTPEWTSRAVKSIQTRSGDNSLTQRVISTSSDHMTGGAGKSRLISEMTHVLSSFWTSNAATPSVVKYRATVLSWKLSRASTVNL